MVPADDAPLQNADFEGTWFRWATNFDMRSFELNDEASLNVYDEGSRGR